jgi:hypothetical protein
MLLDSWLSVEVSDTGAPKVLIGGGRGASDAMVKANRETILRVVGATGDQMKLPRAPTEASGVWACHSPTGLVPAPWQRPAARGSHARCIPPTGLQPGRPNNARMAG